MDTNNPSDSVQTLPPGESLIAPVVTPSEIKPEKKQALDIRELISDDSAKEALRVLEELVKNEKVAPSIRLQAADSLLDRKFGKAKQSVEMKAEVYTIQDVFNQIAEKEENYQKALTVEIQDAEGFCLEELM